ncbi:hypothetical protein ACDN41_12445 [Priestia aryabhattai]|uniref:hypothetical protein n=1 Tax=Priestia aryabhattai TaxID=412384 RepID=UPI003531A39E
MFKDVVKNIKVKFLCNKDKHNWNYYTWGNACVNNLDGTIGIWDISVRECNCCNRHEMYVKDIWTAKKKFLTINDLE